MDQKDIKKIENVVLISAIVLVLIGVVEIIVGYYVNSVGLIADGTDSISDSVISFMVWFGLRISRKRANKKFHFGYYRVETLVSFIVAILMIAMSIYIIYNEYLRLKNPVELDYPIIGMITLVAGGFISFYLSIIKTRLAKKYKLLSLDADAKTSTKDWTSSFVILVGVFLSYLGFTWGDAIGAFIVSIYIMYMAISIIKQASLILIDGFNNPELMKDIARIIQKYPTVKIKEMKLRMTGPYITGEIVISVDNDMTIKDAYLIKKKIEHQIMERIDGVKDLTILADPENS
ncbi:MAG TPA: cation diffusion facilitator family transporter [Candidatus Nanoarchaeia archaeon]|nr:cation diffusion facilitator family transporter [Candidatus Nanoarchaeia archaeon]